MSVGFWQIVVIAILAVLLFGRGRISDLMGDVAKGIKSFKKGLSDEDSQHQATETDITQEMKKISHDATSHSSAVQAKQEKTYKSFD